MNRKKKLFLNTGAAIMNQLITLICGFILPRLIISHYGSATNGLLSSITQFLAFFAMMEMGVGAVVRASLYKPLASHDNDLISRVLISSRRFFRKIGWMLCVYTGALMIYFPIAVDHSNGYLPTVLLVGATAFSALSTYLFGIVYQQLLNADQRSYVQLGISALTTILNTAFGVVLIHMNATIEMVKLFAAFVILLRPLLLKLYVDRHYRINFKLELTEEPIKQKWNGLAQHIATYVLMHADTIILTMFSSLENVSIYYVYHLVTNGLQKMIEILTTGMAALLGNMYAKQENEKLSSTFSAFELLIHAAVTIVYCVAGLMIVPFVGIYTAGVSDADYIVPTFAILIVCANASYCLRMPYYIMTQAAGHFKETQNSAIIEAALNVVISIILVRRYGLIGVAIGTVIAMVYRTIYLACYLCNHILFRPIKYFIGHMAVDAIVIITVVLTTNLIDFAAISWRQWFIKAAVAVIVVSFETGLINFLFYRKIAVSSLKLFKGGKKHENI